MKASDDCPATANQPRPFGRQEYDAIDNAVATVFCHVPGMSEHPEPITKDIWETLFAAQNRLGSAKGVVEALEWIIDDEDYRLSGEDASALQRLWRRLDGDGDGPHFMAIDKTSRRS